MWPVKGAWSSSAVNSLQTCTAQVYRDWLFGGKVPWLSGTAESPPGGLRIDKFINGAYTGRGFGALGQGVDSNSGTGGQLYAW